MDEIEKLRILLRNITPSFIEKLIKLDNFNKGKLFFCFLDNKLHIGIYDNKNSFEPEKNVFKRIDVESAISKLSKEI